MESMSLHQNAEELRRVHLEAFKKKREEKKKGIPLKTAEPPQKLEFVVVDTSNGNKLEASAGPAVSVAPAAPAELPPLEAEPSREAHEVAPEMTVDIDEEAGQQLRPSEQPIGEAREAIPKMVVDVEGGAESSPRPGEHHPLPEMIVDESDLGPSSLPPPLTEEQLRQLEEEKRKREAGLETETGRGGGDNVRLDTDDPKRKIELKVISVDEIVKSYAFQKAEQKIRELLYASEEGMASGSRPKSVFNNVWGFIRNPWRTVKRTWLRAAEDQYLFKFYREAVQEIESNQNLLLELQAGYALRNHVQAIDPNRKQDIDYEILDKVIKEYCNNAVEEEERGNKISDPRVDAAFQNLLSCYYINGWNRKQFEAKQRKMINELKNQKLISNADFLGASGLGTSGRKAEEVDQGLMYATNLFQIAQDYKAHIDVKLREMGAENNLTPEQKALLKEHVMSTMNLDISLGAKLSDIHNKRPQNMFGRTERIVSAMQQCRIPILGRIASNPGTYAIVGGIAGNLIVKGMGRATTAAAIGGVGLATGAWIPVVSAGVMAGLYAWRRRSLEVKKDRAMHQREKILGKEFDNFRRTNMDQYEYSDVMRTAAELQAELDEIKAAGAYGSLTREQKERLANMLALFKTEVDRDKQYRISGGENVTVDLIKAVREEGEKYETNLMSKTDLKIALYQYLHENSLLEGDNHRVVDPVAGAGLNDPNREFKILFNNRYAKVKDYIDNVDRDFERYRRSSARTMGLLGLLGGCMGAIAGQWAVNRIREAMGGSGYTAWDSIADKFRRTGNTKAEATVKEFFFGGKELGPGAHKFITPDKEQIQIFVDSKGDLDYGETDRHLPKGWRLEGDRLVHEIPDVPQVNRFNDWGEFAKTLDSNYAGQRVVYGDPFYQGTAPDKGIRALPEFFRNLFHNKKLNADLTELMMDYMPGDNKGEVIVDASRMFGKMLKKSLDEQGMDLKELLESGQKICLNLALNNEINGGEGSQFRPIMIPMDTDGKVRVPKEIAKIFFGFDEQGNLLQGPGNHPGLHQLVLVTDEMRGDAQVVRQIAATLGERPEMETTVVSKGGKQSWSLLTKIRLKEYEDTPWVASLNPVSRWPLESPIGKDDKKRKEHEETPPGETPPAGRDSGMASEKGEEKTEEGKLKRIRKNIKGLRERIKKTKEELDAEGKLSGKEPAALEEEQLGGVNPNGSGEFHLNGLTGIIAFEEHKGLFLDPKNLEAILGNQGFGATLKRLEGLEQKELNGEQISNSERNKVIKAHERFKKLAAEKGDQKAAEIDFPEFIFCLHQALEGRKELGPENKTGKKEVKKQKKEKKKAVRQRRKDFKNEGKKPRARIIKKALGMLK